jgi:eukaryotic-like serine/threonine-protein kinase
MTPERYQHITRLCQAALELNASQRNAFLTQACADDDDLRAEIESLLAADEMADSFIDKPALDVAAQLLTNSHRQFAAGQRLSHYELHSRLGAGGMGEVYLAEDERLHRKVALKLLPAVFTQDRERVQRFALEAQAASALNHPNILTIHDIGAVDGVHFMATEYVEGQTLRQLLQRGPLPPTQVIEIAAQIAEALSAAHQAGIVHRDIKPENLMRRPDGYVKVLDFGLAKLTEKNTPHSTLATPHLTSPGKVMGTISYMSPEQALGHNVDHRTDIFSLGVVLYELVTGVQPFKKDSEAATYNAILNQTPAGLTAAQAPLEFAALISRALEKDRDLRFQTAADLRAALKRLQRDSAAHSAAGAAATSATFPLLKRRSLYVGAVLLCLLAGGAFLSRSWWQPRNTFPSANAALSVLPANVTFTQQTDHGGIEYFPTLAPDGQTVVYASQESGNWDLWLQTIGQRDRVNLTRDFTGDDMQPCFSPDGKQLAFRSEREGGGLFVLEVASRKVKKINSEGFNPTWSADNEEVAYGTASIINIEARPNSQLWAVRVNTGEKRLLTAQDAAQPAWSPDGKRIAFYGMQANGHLDLMTIPARGGTPVKVTTDLPVDWNPCWSADGQFLYFTSDRSGSMSLWRVAIDATTGAASGTPEPATTPSTDTYHLSVARNGKYLAYVQRNKRRSIQALGFDPVNGTTSGVSVSLTRGTGAATHPDISPDGQWLTYSSAGSPQPDVYVMRADGTQVRQLTNDIYKDHLPRWSPDGKRIAFFSDRDGKNEIWTVSPDGNSVPQQLTFAGTGRAVLHDWSPDGNFLAYTMLRQGMYLLDLRKPWDQQMPQPLLLAGQHDPRLSVGRWSPDGKKIVCWQYGSLSQHPTTVLYWLATPESASRLEQIAEDSEYGAWLHDSQRMILISAGKLCLVDTRTKASRILHTFGANEIAEYTSLSPDNRTLYFSLASLEADIWLLKL